MTRMALLGLVLAASGCSTVPSKAAPWVLLEDCPAVACTYADNGALVRCIEAQRASLKVCQTDKELLRQWFGVR